MTKIYPDATAALHGVLSDGITIMVGGFGLCGIPEALIAETHHARCKGLTIISNNCGMTGDGLWHLLNEGQIRKIILSSGIITTAAGNGQETYSGDGGPAAAAAVAFPKAVAVDSDGNLFIADSNNVIRRVAAGTQTISKVAGTGVADFSGDNGPAAAATLGFPYGVAVDASGNLFISDTYNNRIRAVRAPVN